MRCGAMRTMASMTSAERPLARRIDDDDIRRLPGGAEALGGPARASAQKNSAFPMPVAAGVFLRIADGGLDKLDADGALRLPRKAEREVPVPQ